MKKLFFEFLKEMARRAISDTPAFFKQLQKAVATIVSIATTISLLPLSGLPVPDKIQSICHYIIAIGTGMLGASQLAKIDNPEKK